MPQDDPYAPESTLRMRTGERVTSVPEPPPTFWEGVEANFDAVSGESMSYSLLAEKRAYRQVFEQLVELGEDRMDLLYFAKRGHTGGQYDRARIFAAVRRQQEQGRMLDLPATFEEFNEQWRAQDNARLQRADERAAQSGIVPSLIGGTAGAFTDPFNVMTLPFGGFGRTIAARIGTEVLVNASIEAAQQPVVASVRAQQGRDELTMGEHWFRIAGAGIGAGIIRGGVEIAPAFARAVTPQDFQAFLAMRRDMDGARINPFQITREAIEAQDPGLHGMSPVERDALLAGEAEVRMENANPFRPNGGGVELHNTLLSDALGRALTDNPFPDRGAYVPPAAVAAAPVRRSADGSAPAFVPRAGGAASGGDVSGRFMERVRSAESGGNDAARNPRSSATGRYQFTDSTWLAYYKRRYGTGGLTDEQILARRTDGNIQDALMRDLTEDNAAALRRGGEAVTEGNLYLAHFAGPGGALAVLRADPGADLGAVLGAAVVRANPFLRGRNAAWLVRWAAEKMGSAPPRRGNARITFDDSSPLARLQAEGAAAQDALDAAIARADALAEAARAGPDGVPSPLREAEEAGWEPVLADYDGRLEGFDPTARAEDAGPPEVDWLLPALRAVVATPGRSLNAVDALARDIGATPAEVRTALDFLVENGTIIRRSNGNVQRRPPARPRGSPSLVEFLAGRGGLADEGSLRASDGRWIRQGNLRSMGAGDWNKQGAFRRQLLRAAEGGDGGADMLGGDFSGKGRGSHEEAFEAAISAGYFPEYTKAAERYGELPDIDTFYAAIRDELHGSPRYSIDDETRAVDGTRIAGDAVERENLEYETRMREDFLADLEDAEVRIDYDDDTASLIDEALLYWHDSGRDALEVLQEVARWRYEDLLARASNELGERFEGEVPGWRPISEEEFAEYLARDYGDDASPGAGFGADAGEPFGAGGARGLEPGAARRGGDPATRDREIGEQLARLPEAERTQFLDPDGPAAKAQAESMAHDARTLLVEVQQADGFGTFGRAQYLRRFGDLWKLTDEELAELFDKAKLAEAASLSRAIDLIGFEPSKKLTRTLQRNEFYRDKVADMIEREAKAAGKTIPDEADRIINPTWDDPPINDLPMSEDVAALRAAISDASDDDVHMLTSHIGWSLRDLKDMGAVLDGRGSIEDQARMLTVRLASERLSELGVEKARFPELVAAAMVRNGNSPETARELTEMIFRRFAEGGRPRLDAPPLDRGEAVDPAIAERQAQQAQLGAEAPMRAARATEPVTPPLQGQRMGDFIEFFGEDATRVAEALDIAVASRNGQRMAGIPVHSFERYAALAQENGVPIRWDDPDGAPPTLDRGAAADPAIAERQRQQAQLGAEAPMRAAAEQDGTMGLPMFDAADQPMFRLDEADDARDLQSILRDIEAEEAELKKIRDCL